MSGCDGLYYLSDGVYFNFDNYMTDDEREELEAKNLQNKKLNKKREDYCDSKLENLASKFNSTTKLRDYLFKKIVNHKFNYMATRYCRREDLSKDYIDVAMQNDILFDVLIGHLDKLGVKMSLSQMRENNIKIITVYENENLDSIYDRVAIVQKIIHKVTFDNNGEDFLQSLDKEIVRRFLSFSRLHLGITDLKKCSVNVIKHELRLIKSEIQLLNMDEDFNDKPKYVERFNKEYVKKWKIKSMKSLLWYAPFECRLILLKLLKIRDTDQIGDIKDIMLMDLNICEKI